MSNVGKMEQIDLLHDVLEWYDLHAISENLKSAALKLAICSADYSTLVSEIQLAAISACEVLDEINEININNKARGGNTVPVIVPTHG